MILHTVLLFQCHTYVQPAAFNSRTRRKLSSMVPNFPIVEPIWGRSCAFQGA